MVENTFRPSVGHDVVHGSQQHMILLCKPQQLHPQHRTAHQVERHSRFAAQRLLHPFLLRTLLLTAQILQPQHDPAIRFDHLEGFSLHFHKARAQTLVPLHNRTQRPLQRRFIQISLQPQSPRHVVLRACALQPVYEPQPLLRMRQRKLFRTLPRRQRRPAFLRALAQIWTKLANTGKFK